MGIRADRRLRRQQEANKHAIPGGKAVLPSAFVFGFCRTCEHNRQNVFDPTREENVYINACGKRCRKHIYHADHHSAYNKTDPKTGAVTAAYCHLVVGMWPNLQLPNTEAEAAMVSKKVSACDVTEQCPNLVLMLMDADIGGLYSF
jgi:hypothetical protein